MEAAGVGQPCKDGNWNDEGGSISPGGELRGWSREVYYPRPALTRAEVRFWVPMGLRLQRLDVGVCSPPQLHHRGETVAPFLIFSRHTDELDVPHNTYT